MQKNLKELFLIEHFIGLFTKNDTTQMKNLSMPKWLTKKQPKYKAVFLWGDLDQDQWSKICLDHGASKELANPLWSWIHRFFWCTMIQTHDPDHPKGMHPKFLP